jgi:hypothetical protein
MEFEHEVEKLLVTNFSVLELHLNTKGHVFGALVARLLKIHHIRTNTRKLKVVLRQWFQVFIHLAYISYTRDTCSKYILMFFFSCSSRKNQNVLETIFVMSLRIGGTKISP